MKYDVLSNTCFLDARIFPTNTVLPCDGMCTCGVADMNFGSILNDGAIGMGPSVQRFPLEIGSIVRKKMAIGLDVAPFRKCACMRSLIRILHFGHVLRWSSATKTIVVIRDGYI